MKHTPDFLISKIGDLPQPIQVKDLVEVFTDEFTEEDPLMVAPEGQILFALYQLVLKHQKLSQKLSKHEELEKFRTLTRGKLPILEKQFAQINEQVAKESQELKAIYQQIEPHINLIYRLQNPTLPFVDASLNLQSEQQKIEDHLALINQQLIDQKIHEHHLKVDAVKNKIGTLVAEISILSNQAITPLVNMSIIHEALISKMNLMKKWQEDLKPLYTRCLQDHRQEIIKVLNDQQSLVAQQLQRTRTKLNNADAQVKAKIIQDLATGKTLSSLLEYYNEVIVSGTNIFSWYQGAYNWYQDSTKYHEQQRQYKKEQAVAVLLNEEQIREARHLSLLKEIEKLTIGKQDELITPPSANSLSQLATKITNLINTFSLHPTKKIELGNPLSAMDCYQLLTQYEQFIAEKIQLIESGELLSQLESAQSELQQLEAAKECPEKKESLFDLLSKMTAFTERKDIISSIPLQQGLCKDYLKKAQNLAILLEEQQKLEVHVIAAQTEVKKNPSLSIDEIKTTNEEIRQCAEDISNYLALKILPLTNQQLKKNLIVEKPERSEITPPPQASIPMESTPVDINQSNNPIPLNPNSETALDIEGTLNASSLLQLKVYKSPSESTLAAAGSSSIQMNTLKPLGAEATCVIPESANTEGNPSTLTTVVANVAELISKTDYPSVTVLSPPVITPSSAEEVVQVPAVSPSQSTKATPIKILTTDKVIIDKKSNLIAEPTITHPLVEDAITPSSSDSLPRCPSKNNAEDIDSDNLSLDSEMEENVDPLRQWHHEIQRCLSAPSPREYSLELQNWYNELYINANKNDYRFQHLVRDIHFTLTKLPDSNLIEQYSQLCPEPRDILQLLLLKPNFPPNLITSNSLAPKLKELHQQYTKLKKTHPKEAALTLHALEVLNTADKLPSLPKKDIPLLSADPLYTPLKWHRGILKIWEIIEDFFQQLIEKAKGHASCHHIKRPCFFNTHTLTALNEVNEEIINTHKYMAN